MTSPRTEYTSNVISCDTHTLNAVSVHCTLYISRHVVCHECIYSSINSYCSILYFMNISLSKHCEPLRERGLEELPKYVTYSVDR